MMKTAFGKFGLMDLDNPYCQAWLVGVPAVSFVLYLLFAITGWPKIVKKDGKVKSGAALMSFEITAGLCVAYVAAAGVLGTFGFVDSGYAATASDPMYGRSVYAENHLIYPMIGYQLWNFLLCFMLKELRDINMIGHHLVTGMLAYFGLNPFIQFYAFYFFGVAELSNIPLTLVDVFKYFPALSERFPTINMLCRLTFVLAFYVLRIFIWPVMSFPFWKYSIELLQNGKAHSNFVVGYALVANVFLTGLQFLWGYKILGFVKNTLKGRSKPTTKTA